MAPLVKEVTKPKQTGTKTVTKTKGVFKKEEYLVEEPIYENITETTETGEYSDSFIDIENLSVKIEQACNDLDYEGYDIMNIFDVTSGRYSYDGSYNLEGAGWGYGYGYSVTDGVIITARLKDI